MISLLLDYDGTNFQLLGEGGDYGTAIANDVVLGKTIGTDTGLVTGTKNLSNLIASNVKSGINIDGIVGNVIPLEFLAGDNAQINIGANSGTQTTYTPVANITPTYAGTYRICFDLKLSSTGVTCFGRIYNATTAQYIGTQRVTYDATYATFAEDLVVQAGHRIELHCRVSDSARQYNATNFAFKTSMPKLFT